MNYTKPKAVGRSMPDCPVCGKTTYSRSGIHPQCASERADRVAQVARKAALASAPEIVPAVQPRQQWKKQCVRCHRQVPARRAVCDCGFEFPKKSA
jgi:hypothetical protein